ncbi:MAG: hypothetical protein J7M11_05440 [Elusimicrobia bacterium]|nr:hypothetical protein [Elusimicrobiota bacterium]
MNNPDSPWGKAAYKNFVFLTQRKFSFLLSGAVKFDSNLSYLPELEPDKLSDSFLDLYFRMKYNLSANANCLYSYSSSLYSEYSDYNFENHMLQLKYIKGKKELFARNSYAISNKEPFYLFSGMGFNWAFWGIEGKIKDYEGSYNYLDGWEIKSDLSGSFKTVNFEYTFRFNKSDDLTRDSSYHLYISSAGNVEYMDLQTTTTSYFLSSSYSSHRVKIKKSFKLDKKTRLSVSFIGEVKKYADSNYWYRSKWLKDDAGNWFYKDEAKNAWVASSQGPLGVRLSKSRIDSKFTAHLGMSHELRKNLSLNVFCKFTKNISNFEKGDISDYNWQKYILGINTNFYF